MDQASLEPSIGEREDITPEFVAAVRTIMRRKIEAEKKKILGETKVLVFGPGKGQTDEYKTREDLRKHVSRYGCIVNYPEEILSGSGLEPASAEPVLSDEYNLLLLLLIGPGPISEFSNYINIANLAPKFRVFQEKEHALKPSLVNSMVKPFCNLYIGYCNVFSNINELHDGVDAVIKVYVEYTFAYRHRPT